MSENVTKKKINLDVDGEFESLFESVEEEDENEFQRLRQELQEVRREVKLLNAKKNRLKIKIDKLVVKNWSS
jgi:hypothetical protein